MKAKYKHTNIIAGDWQKLAKFYEEVFGCQRLEPERHLSGGWLEQGTGVADAELAGIHFSMQIALPHCCYSFISLPIKDLANYELSAGMQYA